MKTEIHIHIKTLNLNSEVLSEAKEAPSFPTKEDERVLLERLRYEVNSMERVIESLNESINRGIREEPDGVLRGLAHHAIGLTKLVSVCVIPNMEREVISPLIQKIPKEKKQKNDSKKAFTSKTKT